MTRLRKATVSQVATFAGLLPHELPGTPCAHERTAYTNQTIVITVDIRYSTMLLQGVYHSNIHFAQQLCDSHVCAGNPFQLLHDFPPAVIYFLLTPTELPGMPHPEDDRAMEFERKMLANGEYSELTLARKAYASLDERQRVGVRPPPRTLATLPRSTSSHPMPYREQAKYKQGMGSSLVPGLRSHDADGDQALPGPRGRRLRPSPSGQSAFLLLWIALRVIDRLCYIIVLFSDNMFCTTIPFLFLALAMLETRRRSVGRCSRAVHVCARILLHSI